MSKYTLQAINNLPEAADGNPKFIPLKERADTPGLQKPAPTLTTSITVAESSDHTTTSFIKHFMCGKYDTGLITAPTSIFSPHKTCLSSSIENKYWETRSCLVKDADIHQLVVSSPAENKQHWEQGRMAQRHLA